MTKKGRDTDGVPPAALVREHGVGAALGLALLARAAVFRLAGEQVELKRGH